MTPDEKAGLERLAETISDTLSDEYDIPMRQGHDWATIGEEEIRIEINGDGTCDYLVTIAPVHFIPEGVVLPS
jgi:hypothetical protein